MSCITPANALYGVHYRIEKCCNVQLQHALARTIKQTKRSILSSDPLRIITTIIRCRLNTSSYTSVSGHIYLIDDDASIRRALTGTLERLGYSVSVYEAPEDFLKNAVPISPAVVLLDMRMPGKSGVEVQAELIANKWQTPIIFISGESLPAQIVRAMKQGAADFLLKPFSMESLLRAVDSGLAKDAELHAVLMRSHNIQQRYSRLTPREKEVCLEMISGRSNKEIAEISGSAAATIKLHRARVLGKMEAKSLSDLIAMFEGTDLLTSNKSLS